MSIESAIEQKIKDAIARGEFDDLAGSGKPLDLDAYFNTPEDLRMAFAILLRSNDFVPEEVEMLKEIAELKEKIKDAGDEEKGHLTKTLHEKTLALALILERYSRKR